MDRQRLASRLSKACGPWKWLPVLWLVGFGIVLTVEPALVYLSPPAYLLIPMATYLGQRYGRSAIPVMLVGALPVAVGVVSGPISSAGDAGLYVVALWVCALAASDEPVMQRVPHLPQRTVVLAIALLPLGLGLWGSRVLGLEFCLAIRLQSALYFALFLSGFGGLPTARIALALATATLCGWLLTALGLPLSADKWLDADRAELPLLGLTQLRSLWVRYGLHDSAELLAGFSSFLVGRCVATLLRRRTAPPPRSAFVLLMFVTVLATGSGLNALLNSVVFGKNLPPLLQPLVVFTGSQVTLPIAALLAGALLGQLGVGLVLVLVLLDWATRPAVLAFGGWTPVWELALQEPLYTLGFGALGIRLRDVARGTRAALWSSSWALYTAVLAVAIPLLLRPNGFKDLAPMLFAFIGSAVAGALAGSVWRKLRGATAPTHGGWLGFVSLLLIFATLARNLGGARQLLSTVPNLCTQLVSPAAGSDWPPRDNELLLPGIAIFFVWLFLAALTTFIRNLSPWWQDIREILASVRRLLGAPSPVQGEVAPPLPSAAQQRALPVLDAVRRTALIPAIALPSIAIAFHDYPHGGLLGTPRRWLVRTATSIVETRTEENPTSKVQANAQLWQAALEYLGDKPIAEADPGGYVGRIRTDWFDPSGDGTARMQMTLWIGNDLGPQSVSVSLRLQKRGRFGLWLESDHDLPALQAEAAQRDEIRRSIFERAQQGTPPPSSH